METNNFFEQAVNISKAHGYDILAKQVGELKEINKELINSLQEAIILIDNHRNEIGVSLYKAYPMVYNRMKSAIKKAKILSL